MYSILTVFETMYTKERSAKIESTDSWEKVVGAISVYMSDPECIDIVVKGKGKIILAYSNERDE